MSRSLSDECGSVVERLGTIRMAVWASIVVSSGIAGLAIGAVAVGGMMALVGQETGAGPLVVGAVLGLAGGIWLGTWLAGLATVMIDWFVEALKALDAIAQGAALAPPVAGERTTTSVSHQAPAPSPPEQTHAPRRPEKPVDIDQVKQISDAKRDQKYEGLF